MNQYNAMLIYTILAYYYYYAKAAYLLLHGVFVVLGIGCNVCIDIFTLDAGLLARSQYSEGPATGHLDTGFSWFPCVFKQMLRWFPRFQVATTCFSCSPPDVNLVGNQFHVLYTC
jgi:hypothetical protein